MDAKDPSDLATTLVAQFAQETGYPDLADYFAAMTMEQLCAVTETDLIKNVAAKHRIQMISFAKHHASPYLAPE